MKIPNYGLLKYSYKLVNFIEMYPEVCKIDREVVDLPLPSRPYPALTPRPNGTTSAAKPCYAITANFIGPKVS